MNSFAESMLLAVILGSTYAFILACALLLLVVAGAIAALPVIVSLKLYAWLL